MASSEGFNKRFISAMQTELLAEQRALREQLELATASSETVALDQQKVGRLSRMDAMQQQAMAKAESARAKRQLACVAAALARIQSDDYGYCLECDEPIAKGRLQANPSASLCINCAE